MTGWRKWRRRLVRAAIVLVLLVALIGVTGTVLMSFWVAEPPPVPEKQAITELKPHTEGGRVYLGRNWFGHHGGLPVVYVTGTPFEMGYANGLLTQKFIQRQEAAVLAMLDRVAPQAWIQSILKFMVVYKNRDLPDFIATPHQVEIYGSSRGCPDPFPRMGPYYHRVLNYHAAQDISYMMMHHPLIQRGCTAFGAWGSQTRDGNLLTGRNFDWEADPIFDQDRMVMLCEPADGIPFISLSWAGMVGCVSGMNRAGVSITVNGAPSDLPRDIATPTCLVAREVLQYAHNLDEAKAIIRTNHIFVSALFLVGSRADGRFVVVEKTPTHMAVREPGDASSIICANHYQTPELEPLEINNQFKEADTSLPRYARMEELLRQAAGPIDSLQAAAILRDRQLPGNRFVGNGHRSSLNPLIATHAVIMDLTSGTFWAATPPHQLGQFVAFDVANFQSVITNQNIPADPILASGEYQRAHDAQKQLDQGWRALKQNDYPLALQHAESAESANPGYYANAWLRAQALFKLGRNSEAQAACRLALDGQPALAGERKKITQLSHDIAAAREQTLLTNDQTRLTIP